MPSPINYSYEYVLGTSAPTGSTTYSSPNSTTVTFTDSWDGDDNSSTDVGAFLNGPGGQQQLEGVTPNGDPMIVVGPFYVVYSNDPNLAGQNVNVQTTGTYLYCFGAGTQIATPSGETSVEALTIGDQILTADGTPVPVKWLGRQTIHTRFNTSRAQPVRIRAGALGDGLPHSDLTVTADHGMLVDGYVINASALINGDTIDWVAMSDLGDRFTVYHIETETHDVILANGAPSETFIDIPGRAAFDNYQEYLDLYGTERIIPEMRHLRITTRRLLPDAIKARLGIVDAVPLAISA